MKRRTTAVLMAVILSAGLCMTGCAQSTGGSAGSGAGAADSAAAAGETAAESASDSGAGAVQAAALEATSAEERAAIEEALNLANNEEVTWTYDSDADAWVMSIVTAVVNPEIEDEQGVSVCVPGAYVTGIDTDGDGSADVTAAEIEERFGVRVMQIVLEETQTKHEDPRASWDARKQEALDRMRVGSREQKIVALGDKLSNMRAISRDYEQMGEKLFFRFHQHDKRRHAWYYRSCAALLKEELGETDAWHELNSLIEYVFADCPRGACADEGEACAG